MTNNWCQQQLANRCPYRYSTQLNRTCWMGWAARRVYQYTWTRQSQLHVTAACRTMDCNAIRTFAMLIMHIICFVMASSVLCLATLAYSTLALMLFMSTIVSIHRVPKTIPTFLIST